MLCDARITKAQVAAVAGGADLTLRPGTADLMLLLQERGVRPCGAAAGRLGYYLLYEARRDRSHQQLCRSLYVSCCFAETCGHKDTVSAVNYKTSAEDT